VSLLFAMAAHSDRGVALRGILLSSRFCRIPALSSVCYLPFRSNDRYSSPSAPVFSRITRECRTFANCHRVFRSIFAHVDAHKGGHGQAECGERSSPGFISPEAAFCRFVSSLAFLSGNGSDFLADVRVGSGRRFHTFRFLGNDRKMASDADFAVANELTRHPLRPLCAILHDSDDR
jgi:hypothetical protein